MKLYESKENTPLFFYKFFRNFWIPLTIISTIYYLIQSFTENNFDLYKTLSDVVGLILSVFIFVGLLKWKRYTITLLFIELIIGLVNIVKNTIYYSYSDPTHLLSLSIISIIAFVFNCVIFVYFYKRKRLLDGIPYKIPATNAKYQDIQKNYYVDTPITTDHIDDNRERCECGYPILYPENEACPDCGKEYKIMSKEKKTDEAL